MPGLLGVCLEIGIRALKSSSGLHAFLLASLPCAVGEAGAQVSALHLVVTAASDERQ